jgi:hypothetical protein
MWEHTTRIITLGNGEAHAVLKEMKADGWEYKSFESDQEMQEQRQYRCVFARLKQ